MGMEQVKEIRQEKERKLYLLIPLVIVILISFTLTYNVTMSTISYVEPPFAEWEVSILDGFEDTTFSDIEFFNASHGWMTGWEVSSTRRGSVLATKDGGQSWDIKLELNTSTRSLSILSSSNIWLSSSGILYHSIDGGESWIKVDIPIDDPSQAEFFNESYGWVGSNDGLAKTLDGGNSWIEIDSLPDHTFPNSFHITPTIVRITTIDGIYHSSDFGETWNIECEKATKAMCFISDRNGWAAHPNTISEYHGIEWNENIRFSRLLNQHSPSFHNIRFIDEHNGWLAGYLPAIAYTPDGGLSWYEHEVGNYNLMTVEVFNKSHCWAAGWRGVVARTTTGHYLGPRLHTGLYLRDPVLGGGRMIPYEPLLTATTLSILFGLAFYCGERRLQSKKSRTIHLFQVF